MKDGEATEAFADFQTAAVLDPEADSLRTKTPVAEAMSRTPQSPKRRKPDTLGRSASEDLPCETPKSATPYILFLNLNEQWSLIPPRRHSRQLMFRLHSIGCPLKPKPRNPKPEPPPLKKSEM